MVEMRAGKGEATVGGYLLLVEKDRLVVRQCRGEYGCGYAACLVGGPLLALVAAGFLQSEIRDPGSFLKALDVDEWGLRHLDRAGWPFKLLSVGAATLLTLLLGLVSLLLFRELFRKLRYGRRPWVFDRSEDLFLLGYQPIGQLSFIHAVSIDREAGRGGLTYYVSLLPEPFLLDTQKVFKGPPQHVFAFDNRKDATVFGETIADFLRVQIVKHFD